MRWAAYILVLLNLGLFFALNNSLMALIAIIALIALPLVSLVLNLLLRKKVRLELTVPAVVQKGKEFPIGLGAKLPFGRLEVTLCACNCVTGERVRKTFRLSDRESRSLSSRYCGCLFIKAEKVRLYDPLGLLWVKAPAPKEKRVMVMPDTFPMDIRRDYSPTTLDDAEDYAQDRKGQDRSETYQIRNYVPGDALTQIHWKLSSKLDQLMVRDPGCPIDQSLMVFLDRSWGELPAACADAIMETAVSVCQSLSEAAVPFRLVWNEESIVWRDVSDSDMLPEAVGALLKSRVPEGALPGPETYLGLYGSPNSARILHIGGTLPDCMEQFGAGRQLLSLLCTPDPVEGAVCFTPETMEETLARLYF